MKKKLLSIFLSLIMVFAMVPSAFAADITTAGQDYETNAYLDTYSTWYNDAEGCYTANMSYYDYETANMITYSGTGDIPAGYEIYVSDAEDGEYVLADTAPFNAYYESYFDEYDNYIETDTIQYLYMYYDGLYDASYLGQTMWYKARSYYLDGTAKKYSNFTPASSVKIQPDTVYPYGTCVGTTSIKLTWYQCYGVDGYYIYRYDKSSGTYKKVKTITDPETVSWTNKKLAKNTTYKYKVAAYVEGTDGKIYVGPKSDVVKVKTSSNQFKYTADTSSTYMTENLGNIMLQETKGCYVDGKLQITFNTMNLSSNSLKKYSWIRISIYDEYGGTLIAQQKFKNINLNLDQYDFKKITYTFDKGTKKKNVNLRNGIYWEAQWNTEFN